MRIFEEIAIISLLLICIVRLIKVFKKPNIFLVLSSVNLLIIILHLIIDGFIIQMLLIYILAIWLFLKDIIKWARKKQKEYRNRSIFVKILIFSGSSIYILIAVVLPLLFQLPPKPTGSYPVANISYEWMDTSRYETFTEDGTDYRDLAVTVWYPCSRKTNMAGLNGTMKKVNQVSDGQDSYPVLIFSHGFGMNIESYAVLLEEVASHGYIIFAINHPYEASSVQYPDGRIVGMSTAVLNSLQSDDQKKVNQLLDQFKNETDPDKKNEIFIELDTISDRITGNSMKIWTDDTIFVLNKIEELSKVDGSAIFGNFLDMDNIGVFGHSFGGAISAQACLFDKRIDAGINLDGFQFGQIKSCEEGSITQPFLEMTSADSITGFNDYIYSRSNNVMYRMYINGSRHNNFADIAMYMPSLRQTALMSCGAINPVRMYRIVSNYCLAFFDNYLKSQESAILTDTEKYPEIELRKE